MSEFAAQLEKAKELAVSGSLVVPPAQSETLWLPPVKEPEPDFTDVTWHSFMHYGLSNFAPPPSHPKKEIPCPAF
jgi:hypothetical protein